MAAAREELVPTADDKIKMIRDEVVSSLMCRHQRIVEDEKRWVSLYPRISAWPFGIGQGRLTKLIEDYNLSFGYYTTRTGSAVVQRLIAELLNGGPLPANYGVNESKESESKEDAVLADIIKRAKAIQSQLVVKNRENMAALAPKNKRFNEDYAVTLISGVAALIWGSPAQIAEKNSSWPFGLDEDELYAVVTGLHIDINKAKELEIPDLKNLIDKKIKEGERREDIVKEDNGQRRNSRS